MKTIILMAVCLSLVGQPATAGVLSGNSALSLTALVGQHSPHLSKAEKSPLLGYLNGDAKAKIPKTGAFVVKADSVTCRISNVDITDHSCELKFGARTVSLAGRAAHEVYAALIENGVESQGAAGSMIAGVGTLECGINPAEVKAMGGGGAKCDYAPAK